ncbi:MAG: NAD(P)-binding domain-containing protein [Thermodesulfobacteriaceae bacterium]|nr:NAD(P)-binding domain-containing protein [Thermodesulfobacteriaceae bacterium]MDW8135350.1 NAD(P)-dependent oxidoreductase [Thermodesulfobacterium sp.]
MHEKICFFEITKDWDPESYSQKIKNKLEEVQKRAEILFVEEPLKEENAGNHWDITIASIYLDSVINEQILQKMPSLKLIITRTVGFDHIDILACKRRGIIVSNVPSYAPITAAEYVFSLIFTLARRFQVALEKIKNFDFSREGLLSIDLFQKTIGIIGTGNIGSEVARLAYGIGMRVIAYDINPSSLLVEKYKVEYVSLEQLLKESDIIILMIPYYSKTYHFINKENIRLVKENAMLINVARGPLVETDALLWALENGKLKGGVALDVFEGDYLFLEELYLKDQSIPWEECQKSLKALKLLSYPQVIYTPRLADYTEEGLEKLKELVIRDIVHFLTYGSCITKVEPYF